MSPRSRNTKSLMWRWGRVTNRLSRLRHLRGYGIHSPFVYGIIREVFMSRQLHPKGVALFESLRALKIGLRNAREIANMQVYCNCDSFSIDDNSGSSMIICSDDCPDNTLLSLCFEAKGNGTTIVILSPYRRKSLCERLLREHESTSIDRFGYIILLNNHLPKQHFKL